jgi:hypothetical protein
MLKNHSERGSILGVAGVVALVLAIVVLSLSSLLSKVKSLSLLQQKKISMQKSAM